MWAFQYYSLQSASNGILNVIQCFAELWSMLCLPTVTTSNIDHQFECIFEVHFKNFVIYMKIAILFQKFLIFKIMDDFLKIQVNKKYTRRQRKDGSNDFTHPFNIFLKEIDEMKGVRDFLRHWIRQLMKGEKL